MNRKDGIKIKNLDGMHSLIPFIMPKRVGSDVYINTNIDVTEMVNYVENLKKDEKYKNLTFFHIFCTAIGKTVYNRPLLNRFIINKNFYDRKEITLAFVAKKQFTDTSEEVFKVITIEKKDNLFTLSKKISQDVKEVRSSKTNNTDDFINNIGKLPKFIRWFLIKLIKFADNHDLLPQSLTKNSIYHSSILLSNLGSINCGGIYHHLTDFGTNSIILTIGKIKDEPAVIDGKVKVRKMCEFGINLDERIADGFYFAKALNLFKYILENPKLLEEDANSKITIETK